MCGIVAIISKEKVKEKLLESLTKLEYRGYDSAGLAIKRENDIALFKRVGKVSNLKESVKDMSLNGNLGIAHTRWATHGNVSQVNAHPFKSENWCLVHNGIINNFEELKTKYNITTQSQTDTEVIVQLLEKEKTNDIFALINVCKKLKGSYALAVLNKNTNDIYFAKEKSPLFVAKNNSSVFGGSDVICFANFSNSFYSLMDGEFCKANTCGLTFYDKNFCQIEKQSQKLKQISYNVSKDNFKHYMQKEINETPQVISNIFQEYKTKKIINLPKNFLKKINRVKFIACGTAYHSAMFGAQYFEKTNKIESSAHLANEFETEYITKKTLCIFVSQSGETQDTINALNIAKKHHCKTIAITNVMHSTIASLADYCFPILAGVEIAVASTKAYCAQILVMEILANYFANQKKQEIFWKKFEKFAKNFKMPKNKNIERIKNHIKNSNQCFILGRAKDYFTARESALKIKEITYINCTSMASGELKHGTLALVDNIIPLILFCTNKKDLNKSISAKKEMEARGGNVLFITPFKKYDALIEKYDDEFMAISAIVPIQLCAYYISCEKGINPDQPRNLAKSVTVE